MRIEDGEHNTATEVIVGGVVTVTVADPDFEVSWVEVAVMLAVPVVAGVKSPLLFIVPIPDGLTDHVIELLKLPVPITVGVQVEV